MDTDLRIATVVRCGVAACLLGLATTVSAQQPRVERYTFAIELPAIGTTISANARVEFTDFPVVDTVVLDLDGAMRVRGVSFGCRDAYAEAQYERTARQLRVATPRQPATVPSGRPFIDTQCILVSYAGTPADGLIIGTDTAGRWIAFGDNFPNRARYWLPTIDHPSAKAKVSFEVTAPAGRTIVAPGRLMGSSDATNGRVTTKWNEDRAIPTYAMVIAAAPLVMHDLGPTACGYAEDGGCVRQSVWTAPEQGGFMPGRFANAADIVDFYARTFGPFPYEKLAHLQTTTRYGGMENSSAIFYADKLFRTPNGVSDELIAHETAHQWFGDAVTEREWAHAWLSEGFATFLAPLWNQHARGDSAYRADFADIREQVLAAKVVAQRAVIDSVETDPNRLLNANTYGKGGMVLRMLRDQLGDTAFFRGVRAYVAAHRHGNAMTQDLQAALEASSGAELGWFFDQWLRKPGWAEVRTSYTWDARTRQVRLSAAQGDRFGPYRLPVTVEVRDAAGRTTRVRVELQGVASQQVVLPGEYATAPSSVVLDPDKTLLATFTARR